MRKQLLYGCCARYDCSGSGFPGQLWRVGGCGIVPIDTSPQLIGERASACAITLVFTDRTYRPGSGGRFHISLVSFSRVSIVFVKFSQLINESTGSGEIHLCCFLGQISALSSNAFFPKRVHWHFPRHLFPNTSLDISPGHVDSSSTFALRILTFSTRSTNQKKKKRPMKVHDRVFFLCPPLSPTFRTPISCRWGMYVFVRKK